MRMIGTTVRGIRCPVIREGDNLVSIVIDSLLQAQEQEGFEFHDRDVIGITESVVARAQGNYATVDQIAEDVQDRLGNGTIGVVFPILSRNRFAICLKGFARAAKKIILVLSYPADEVGNRLINDEQQQVIADYLTYEMYKKYFGENKHQFTGIDYVEYYKKLIEAEGAECVIYITNNLTVVRNMMDAAIVCRNHNAEQVITQLENNGVKKVIGLSDILNYPVNGSGFNARFGLLGSNKATEEKVKLFPINGGDFVREIQTKMIEITGKHIEVMIYGDGAFKDPVGGIWELADPVVSPAYTDGLIGTPNEVKIKYLADSDFSALKGESLRENIVKAIKNKDDDLKGNMSSQGTTPRNLTDLLGSLCDLTSGSGDKGTPVILIQGYFDNFASE